MSNKLPAGLMDQNVEFFEHENHLNALQGGIRKDYSEVSDEVRKIVQRDMAANPDAVKKLKAVKKLSGIDIEKQWVYCRCAGFDNTPDIDIENNRLNPDYHPCPERATCPAAGITCTNPKGLTNKQIEIVILIARGLLDKEIAENLGISILTLGSHKKNIGEKIGLHNKSEITLFAFRNNLIN